MSGEDYPRNIQSRSLALFSKEGIHASSRACRAGRNAPDGGPGWRCAALGGVAWEPMWAPMWALNVSAQCERSGSKSACTSHTRKNVGEWFGTCGMACNHFQSQVRDQGPVGFRNISMPSNDRSGSSQTYKRLTEVAEFVTNYSFRRLIVGGAWRHVEVRIEGNRSVCHCRVPTSMASPSAKGEG